MGTTEIEDTTLNNRLSLQLLGILFGGVIGLLLGVILHEYTHIALYADYGCASGFQWFPGTDLVRIDIADECWHQLPAHAKADLRMAQLSVEAVGYHIVPLFSMVGALFGYQLSRSSS